MNTKQKKKLLRFIKQLDQYRGRHTELVSVYVPQGYEIIKIIQHLQEEQGTASNIKDKTNRNNVIDSLERMIRHLRLYKKTPDNGLAVFAGNISDKENKVDIEVFSIEPPEPLQLRTYRCDQTFLLDPLKDMIEERDVYGLIVVDNREGNIGILKGTMIKEIKSFTSDVPGKTTKGGQCLIFGSLIELNNKDKVKIEDLKVGDKIKSYNFDKKKFEDSKIIDKWEVEKNEFYVINNNLKCSKDHLIFLEDGSTKSAEELNKNDIILNDKAEEVKIKSIKRVNKKTKMIDISVKNQNFIADCVLVHNSQQRYARIREIAAKEFHKKIAEVANKEFLEMKNLKGILLGGPGPTKETFLNENVLNNEVKKKILAVKDLSYTGDFGLKELVEKSNDVLSQQSSIKEKELLDKFFTLLAKSPKKVVYGKEKTLKALEMSAVDILIISDDLDDIFIDEVEEKAAVFGTQVEIVSSETELGNQLKELGGIAGILRFEVY